MRVIAAVAGLLAATNFAWGADLSPPAAPAPYNWNGIYIGGNAGYGFGTATTTAAAAGAAVSQKFPGFTGGGQVGINYQVGKVVWGFEAEFDGSGQSQSLSTAVISGTDKMLWLGTLRGRLGIAFDQFLLYGTAGGAFGELKSNITIAGIGNAITNQTYSTWTAGAGLEYGITDYVSARVEYLYLDTGNVSVGLIGPPAVTVTERVRDNIVRAGLNVRLPVAW
jgi:outer membrane immunogenic protein